MYINEVIRRVRDFYPSEYDDDELYMFCDEVSSMLRTEDREVLREAYITLDKNNTALLPEGVNTENVISVSAGGRELKKQYFMFSDEGCLTVKEEAADSILHVIYRESYRPLRNTKYRGGIVIDAVNKKIVIGAGVFIPGDRVDISFLAADGSVKEELKNIALTDVCRTDDGWSYDVLGEGLQNKTANDALISRVVTDKTVCDAPFDGMYIDYIIAKINLYQRDGESYNRHIAAFNSRLAAYKKWLMNRLPHEGGVLENWW